MSHGTKFRKGGTWKGLTGPKFRPVCADCGKKGMSPWKATAYGWLHRECRYCLRQETKDA